MRVQMRLWCILLTTSFVCLHIPAAQTFALPKPCLASSSVRGSSSTINMKIKKKSLNPKDRRDVKTKASSGTGIPSGSDMSEANMEKSIDDFVEEIRHSIREKASCFTCSGSMEWHHPVDVYYQTRGDGPDTPSTRRLRLPASLGDVEELIRACDVASIRVENRMDGSQTKAYTMNANRFGSSFDIGHTGILHSVQKILAADSEYITAEPNKLSIYEKGGLVKEPEVSPPAPGSGMFGQLVITLPQNFTGGDMIIEHKGNVSRCSPLNSSEQEGSIQWTAFWSDQTSREVEEVTSGARICLSYNLYKGQSTLVPHDVQPPIFDDFYAAMGKLLGSSGFKGILGFPLEETYYVSSCPPFEDEPYKLPDDPLKGRDLLVYNTLTCLAKTHSNFKIEKKHVARPRWYYGDDEEDDEDADNESNEGSGDRKERDEKKSDDDYMFMEWGRFRSDFAVLEEEPDDYTFKMAYSAKRLEVTWARQLRKEDFRYRDYCTYDYKGHSIGSHTESAGCLLVHVN